MLHRASTLVHAARRRHPGHDTDLDTGLQATKPHHPQGRRDPVRLLLSRRIAARQGAGAAEN